MAVRDLMRSLPPATRGWLIVPVAACGFLLWLNAGRIRHVRYVSGIAWEAPAADAASPTGRAGGLRQLIVPEHNSDSYQWIMQTQQMLRQRTWHVRHVDYDNAPFGREVRAPSPYRWWLALCAWLEHLRSGQPLVPAVELAALWADPALHLLLLIAAAAFTAWRFGTYPAALLSLVLAVAFPLAGDFLPGQPTDHGWSQACALWSVLLLLAGPGRAAAAPDAAARPRPRLRWWYFAAGAAGGAGMWISVIRQAPVAAGILVGGIAAAWVRRGPAGADRGAGAASPPWRAWGLGGAAASLAACLIEYLPSALGGGLRLETIHPLYGIAWLGAGELLTWADAAIGGARRGRSLRGLAPLAFGVLAVAAVPMVMLLAHSRGPLLNNDSPVRLSNFANSPAAANGWAWIVQDGFNEFSGSTLLPVLLLGFAAWRFAARRDAAGPRAAIALAAGPVLVALALAGFHLRWWALFDTTLAALLMAVAAAEPPGGRAVRGVLAAAVALGLAPAVRLLAEQAGPGSRETVTDSEVEGLLERDLARWLANQSGPGAVVLAPPDLTASLAFYGGLRGLGSPYWENRDGFTAAVRIAGASTPDEAQAVARGRSLTHVIIPSWDTFLDEYARLGSNDADQTLVGLLHRWFPPRWLQPVPYRLPQIAGFEDQSVALFEVVDVQDNAVALSRLAEYFAEMGQLDPAAAAAQALEQRYPADLGALVARALVALARGDADGFAAAVSAAEPHLARGEDRDLPWDRRVSLAVVLAQAKRPDQAREQVRQCLAGLDEARLRSLSTAALFRLQMMSKAFRLEIAAEPLRALARRLLPEELRARLGKDEAP